MELQELQGTCKKLFLLELEVKARDLEHKDWKSDKSAQLKEFRKTLAQHLQDNKVESFDAGCGVIKLKGRASYKIIDKGLMNEWLLANGLDDKRKITAAEAGTIQKDLIEEWKFDNQDTPKDERTAPPRIPGVELGSMFYDVTSSKVKMGEF